MGLLAIAVQFFVLTWANHNNAAKLKRLAIFALHCGFLSLAALFMAGSHVVQYGIIRTWCMFAWFVFAIVVLVALQTAVETDSPMVESKPLATGLGFNNKGFLTVLTIFFLLWVFINSAFESPSAELSNPSAICKSMIASIAKSGASVFYLEIFLFYLFAVKYGEDKDWELVVGATVILMAPAAFVELYWKSILTIAEFRSSILQQIFIAVIGVASILRSRTERGRNGYETVSTNV